MKNEEILLGPAEQRTLLRLARYAIRDAIFHDGSLQPILEDTEITPGLEAKHGAFVTLNKEVREEGRTLRQLRGCVGTMESEEPLFETLVGLAPRAALEDPRFPPLSGAELPQIRIAISILSPLESVGDPDRLVIGKDGLQLVRGSHRAVFLPQVAVEQGWQVAQLLEQLAVKAGLPKDGWRRAELSSFRTWVFSEDPTTHHSAPGGRRS